VVTVAVVETASVEAVEGELEVKVEQRASWQEDPLWFL